MENQTKTAAESYIFKPFNLEEALKYPHRVWDSYKEKFAKSVHLQEWVEKYNVILKYNDDLTDNDFYTREGKRFYTDENPTLHLLDVEIMLIKGLWRYIPQHIIEIENISTPSKSVEQFTEFNLEIALQKPHLVRSKSYPNLVCRKVSVGDEDDVLVDWAGNHNQFTYTSHGASERLHMLVDDNETETIANQPQLNKTVPDHYKLPNGMDIIDIIQLLGLNFNTGSALKYISRAGKKNNESILDDLRKAQECIRREILYYEKLEAQNKQSK